MDSFMSRYPGQLVTVKPTMDLEVVSMRCVLCGGPFHNPTNQHAPTCLTGLPAAYKWLGCWCRLPSIPEKRRRGEPASFYAHLDCLKLLQNKLGTLPEHKVIWACIKENQTDKAASIPDTLPAGFYLGLADLLQSFAAGNRSPSMLSQGSSTCAAANIWMLHSPLLCSQNAARILTIWQPKLDTRGVSLAQVLSTLLIQPPTKKQNTGSKLGAVCSYALRSPRGAKRVATSQGRAGTRAAGRSVDVAAGTLSTHQPGLLEVLLTNSSVRTPVVLAKLLMTSKSTAAQVTKSLVGLLQLRFASSSTASVMSMAAWLTRHAAMLNSLELDIRISCCSRDQSAADGAITAALVAAAASAPCLALKSFSTAYSSVPQLLTQSLRWLPSLQQVTHLSINDLPSEQQVRCLPPKLRSLELRSSTSNTAQLQMISQQCPKLIAVRLGYNMDPNKAPAGPALLDRAMNGWVLLPVVEMKFFGCRFLGIRDPVLAGVINSLMPQRLLKELCSGQYQEAADPPYMSTQALNQLADVCGLSRLVFAGCCVDASVSHITAVLGKLPALRVIDVDQQPYSVSVAALDSPAGSRRFKDSTLGLGQVALMMQYHNSCSRVMAGL